MISIASSAHSTAKTCSSMIDMSGFTKIAPLNPPIGVLSANGSTSIAMPRGGRPLVMANAMPAS